MEKWIISISTDTEILLEKFPTKFTNKPYEKENFQFEMVEKYTNYFNKLFKYFGEIYNLENKNPFTPRCNLELIMVDDKSNELDSYSMKEAFPVAINFGELDYTSSEEITISLTVRFAILTRKYIDQAREISKLFNNDIKNIAACSFKENRYVDIPILADAIEDTGLCNELSTLLRNSDISKDLLFEIVGILSCA